MRIGNKNMITKNYITQNIRSMDNNNIHLLECLTTAKSVSCKSLKCTCKYVSKKASIHEWRQYDVVSRIMLRNGILEGNHGPSENTKRNAKKLTYVISSVGTPS
jgi:hypothetical protein